MPNSKIHKRRGKLPPIEVVDLFCGIGGLSYGMKSKGLKIKAGFDLDWTCLYAYEVNNEATFISKDIRTVQKEDIIPFYSKKSIKVLAGCAPCQPFSSYAFKNKNKDMRLKTRIKTPKNTTSCMNLDVLLKTSSQTSLLWRMFRL